jgi:hypothetical protein
MSDWKKASVASMAWTASSTMTTMAAFSRETCGWNPKPSAEKKALDFSRSLTGKLKMTCLFMPPMSKVIDESCTLTTNGGAANRQAGGKKSPGCPDAPGNPLAALPGPAYWPRASASILELAAVSRMNQQTTSVQAITPVTYQ